MDHRSKEYVYVPVSADVSDLTVEMSVEPEGSPEVFLPATVEEGGHSVYRLIGPLPKGKYQVLVRITANPEIPVLNADYLYIT